MLLLIKKWGADAIRDSDGTKLSSEITKLGYPIYSTICLVRADQAWAKTHRDQLAQKYLMSAPVTATSDKLFVHLLDGYYKEKYEVDTRHDPKAWWEVIDRTTGQVHPVSNWNFQPEAGTVLIEKAHPFHVYTVSFLVYITWDSTSMYNHLVNGWTGAPVMSVDPYQPDTYQHLFNFFDAWLAAQSNTSVVRLTTLAYHFVIDSDEKAQDRYRDWLGYGETISPKAMEDFASETGCTLRPEDFVMAGYYNATHLVPTERYRAWMAFIQRFVVKYGRELVDRVHAAGKQAAIFWGDHWIGAEPYSPQFQELGIDILIGACEDGTWLRRTADAPGPQLKEVRLYPYFFPDVFRPGGDPTTESQINWAKIRRAMFRRNVDRIGHGGYLSLAVQFPDFVEHVTALCNEFRELKMSSQNTRPYTAPIKVAVLDAWGALRAWIGHATPAQKFHVSRPDVMTVVGSNILECLAGLPVDVTFISFDEIEKNGIPSDVQVIINDGTAYTAWSGGQYWTSPKIVAALREFVYRGGGFIGVEDPSACEYQGRFFQLEDVLGVQKETGQSVTHLPLPFETCAGHFILADQTRPLDLGVQESYVFLRLPKAQVLAAHGNHILAAAHNFGKGRSIYFASMPYTPDTARLLHRAIFWAAQQEESLPRWFSTNPKTDCVAYPETGAWAVANVTGEPQETIVYDGYGHSMSVIKLKPYECRWFHVETSTLGATAHE